MGYIEDRLRSFVEKQTLPEFELRVKFSNFCNLACRSCSETESSTWARVTSTPVSENYEMDISTSPEHWELITTTILQKLPEVEHFYVHFIGGESLVQPGMKKLLNWMIDQGIAPRVHLRVTTALTVRPGYDLMSKMSQFRDVDINLSIDSVGDNYQYLRWPAKFAKIENNLDTLMSHQTTLSIVAGRKTYTPRWRCLITPVFSLNNIMYIDQIMTYWCEQFDQRHYSFPIQPINLTDRTRHLDVEALPVRYRPALIEFLQACVGHELFKKYPDRTRVLFNFINSTIEELKTMPESQEQWLKFLSHNAYFDKKTDQSFAMLNERLYNLLDAADKELIDIMTNDIDIEKQFSQEVTHTVAFFKKLDVQS
jgi:sulfatase maturation enzyme AslB (radical SAM superfamily)